MSDRVKYVGGATVRRITKDQWIQAGVENQDTVEWNRRNGKSVDLADLNDKAIELLEYEPGFRVDREVVANGKSKQPVEKPAAPNGD